MSTLNIKAITSLAVLKVNWETKRDYLDMYVPFLVHAVKNHGEDTFRSEQLATAFCESVGFHIPTTVLEKVLNRVAYKGLFRRSNAGYTVVWDKLPDDDFQATVTAEERKFNQVTKALQSFAKSQFEIEWSDEECESSFLAFLEASSTEIIVAVREGHTLTEADAPKDDVQQGSSYVVAKFLADSIERNVALSEYLESVSVGAMLANVYYYDSPTVVTDPLTSLSAFFDTSILMDLIGANGEARKEVVEEVLQLCANQKVTVNTFVDTLDETQGILSSYASRKSNWQSHGRWNLENSMRPFEAKLAASTLDIRLEEKGVHIVERPSFRKKYALQTDVLDETLQTVVGYENPNARLHDSNAIEAIHRLRRGRIPRSLERSPAIFVTANSRLIRASKQFFSVQYGQGSRATPVCLSLTDLGTMLWLRQPHSSSDLPRKRLIARAKSAARPNPALIERYLAEINELKKNGTVSGDEYILMRSSDEFISAAVDASQNDPNVISEQLVAKVKSDLYAAQRIAAERVANRKVNEIAAELQEMRAQTKLMTRQFEETQKELENLNKTSTSLEKTVGSSVNRASQIARSAAKWSFRITYLLVLVLLVGAVIVTFGNVDNTAERGFWIPLFIVVAAVAEILGAHFGSQSVARQIQKVVERKTKGFLSPPASE